MRIRKEDITYLEEIYKNRIPFYGEMHDHASTGGTSDGKQTLAHWIETLNLLNLDFAAILDHKQVRHMFLPEWKDGVFIGGSEAGTHIVNSFAATNNSLHYNCVFAKPEPFMEVLQSFEEFLFEGGKEGHFKYPTFTRERIVQLISAIKEKGGMFVHAHPTLVMKSENPLDYWFEDFTGFEVFYNDFRNQHTYNNYQLWVKLLALGKKVWACAGGDGHDCCSDKAITTLYAENRSSESYLKHYAKGDFVCGSVGIKMCIGDTMMGQECDFSGKKLIVCINDFHSSVLEKEHIYKMLLLDSKGGVLKRKLSTDRPNYFIFDIDETSKFYRVEVFDSTSNLRIAISNPIWNNN